MNAVTLARMRVKTGTTEELIQAIRDSARRQRYVGLVESGLYLLPDNPDEILAFSMWESLNMLPNFEDNYKKPVNHEVVARSEVISRQTYRMVKEFRVVSARVGASYLRLITFHTSEPEERLERVMKTVNRIRESGLEAGNVGVWLGRLVTEQKTNRLTLLIRHDWLSLEYQQTFVSSDLMERLRVLNQREGAEVEYASLDLAGLVHLESINKETG